MQGIRYEKKNCHLVINKASDAQRMKAVRGTGISDQRRGEREPIKKTNLWKS